MRFLANTSEKGTKANAKNVTVSQDGSYYKILTTLAGDSELCVFLPKTVMLYVLTVIENLEKIQIRIFRGNAADLGHPQWMRFGQQLILEIPLKKEMRKWWKFGANRK